MREIRCVHIYVRVLEIVSFCEAFSQHCEHLKVL